MNVDARLVALAHRAGLEVEWTDAVGTKRVVSVDTLRAVVAALGLAADSGKQIAESEAQLRAESQRVPALRIVKRGEPISIAASRHAIAIGRRGKRIALRLRETKDGMVFRAPREPGYYRIESENSVTGIAVAPARCLMPKDVAPARRLAGIAVQIYALRGGTSGAFGDYAALGQFARQAGRLGIDAILASPAHALFGADPGEFSPYSPSTRLFPNPLFADATLEGASAESDTSETGPINWSLAGPAKYAALRDAYSRFRARGDTGHFEQFCREGGERLLAHALFESLDAHFRSRGIMESRKWPDHVRSSRAPGVPAFARDHKPELEFQLFLQWLAERSATAAQKAARSRMAIGIIADIAVGVNPQGSDSWCAPEELLTGVHVGAPPDIFNTRGQDWGLTTFSPRALPRSGFANYISTLRANMRHAGGVRLDHAMGLQRLWIIPSGAAPSDGVYLRYPERELVRLVSLESHRRGAIVVGEDLGTVPEGFRTSLAKAGVLGMQVLWFERRNGGGFAPPSRWRRDAVAMTTTHDLATVAGWWNGHDIALRARYETCSDEEQRERDERARDRRRAWSAFVRANCASGRAPGADEPDAAVSAALAFVGRTPSALAIASAEDVAGVPDQPNVPGAVEPPNWRLRLPPGELLRDKAARARLRTFTAARRVR